MPRVGELAWKEDPLVKLGPDQEAGEHGLMGVEQPMN